MAPNPDFKGGPLFDVEYLRNDTRYGHPIALSKINVVLFSWDTV